MEDIWFEICKYVKLGDLSVYIQYVCKTASAAARKHIKQQREQNKPNFNIRTFINRTTFYKLIKKEYDETQYPLWGTLYGYIQVTIHSRLHDKLIHELKRKTHLNLDIKFLYEFYKGTGHFPPNIPRFTTQ